MKRPLCLLAILAVFYSGCSKEPEGNEVNNVSIISIAPSSGPAGTMVVIKGAHFGVDPSGNIVRFNNDSAAVLSSSSDSLVVIAPINGTSGPVTVAVAGSTASGPIFTYTTDSVDVYVAAPAMGVEYWKNGQEIFLEATQGNTGGAYGIAVSDTNVYVGGYTHFSTYPGFEAAYWKNGKKTTLSSPDSAGEVRALVLSSNDLYAGGSENYKPVFWKNGIKYSLPAFGGGYARVNALAVDGNDVYAAGFEAGPGNEQRSVYWKNGVETVLGKNGVVDIGATSITMNGNDVYVCATDSGDAVYWKNGVRVTLAKFPGDAPVAATAIALAGNSIYVVGSYRGGAVYWKDGTKITLPKRGLYATASAITFYQSDIYIGGRDGDTPVYWKNGVEIPLCCSQYGAVSAIAVIKKR
jgi:IPT/TIG domain